MIRAISSIAFFFSSGNQLCLQKKDSIQLMIRFIRLHKQWIDYNSTFSISRLLVFRTDFLLPAIKTRSRFLTIPVISCFFFTLLIVQGCKTTSRLPASGQTTSNSAKVLMDSMQRHAFYFEWFTGKAKVEVYEGSNKTEFTASIRMRKDSAIWISVSPALGLEAARVLITRDSIRVIDRLNGEYYSKDYRYFTTYTSMPVTYDLLQDLISGAPLFLDSQTFEATRSDSAYRLVSTTGRQSNVITLNGVFLPVKQTISDSAMATLSISQQQYEIPYTSPFSLWRKIELQQPQAMEIIITFSKIKVNEPVKLPFSVNE